jgi:hypothetical protein
MAFAVPHLPAGRSTVRDRNRTASPPAFTLLELCVGIFVSILAAILFAGMFDLGYRRSHGCGQPRDATQVRGILQGMVIWAQNNQDQYPLPSALDINDATVAATGTSKDSTGNILSILVYHGFVPAEMFQSPSEVNSNIEDYEDYEFEEPAAAIDPANALWDPALHGAPGAADNIDTPNNPATIGNNSYAHTPAVGARRPLWASTFVSTEAAFGNRGPGIIRVSQSPNGPTPVLDPQSNTLLIHGTRDKWEGYIGFNDNHVNFETRPDPQGLSYVTAARTWRTDNLFYDEPDDPAGTNAYLGVWTTAGDTKEDFTGWID